MSAGLAKDAASQETAASAAAERRLPLTGVRVGVAEVATPGVYARSPYPAGDPRGRALLFQDSALPYTSERVVLQPVQPAGGDTPWEKMGLLRVIPQYIRTINKEMKRCDVVHVRCPASISLLACNRRTSK